MSWVEHGTQYCAHSISVEEEKLKKAICRALNKIVEHKQEAMDLIMSNLSYAVTGDDDVLCISSLEKQIKDLDEEMDRTVRLSQESKGDPKRFREMISELCRQMTVLRQELELTKAKLATNEKVSAEIERIKEMLSDETSECFRGTYYDSKRHSPYKAYSGIRREKQAQKILQKDKKVYFFA